MAKTFFSFEQCSTNNLTKSKKSLLFETILKD